MQTLILMVLIAACILLAAIFLHKYETFDSTPKTVCHTVDTITELPERNTITSSTTEICITETQWSPIIK